MVLPATSTTSKSSPGVEVREVAHPPVQVRRLLAGLHQHAGVEVDADDGVPELGQPDRDPAGAAAGVEHPRRRVDQPGTNVASPCTSSPRAAMARKRAAYCSA